MQGVMRHMKHLLLSASENYRLYWCHEEAQLEGVKENRIVVGYFSGQVECGCIDYHEKWIVTGGNGIIIYYMNKPYRNYEYGHEGLQWKELWREKENKDWWPEVIFQTDERTVRVLMDINANAAGVYDIDVYDLSIHRKL